MSKNINFEVGTIVTDDFLDSLQELLTGTINNIRLAPSDVANSRIALGIVGDTVNDNLGTVNIGGKYVYFDSLKECEPLVPSTAGTYNIYLTTTEDDVAQDPPVFKLSIGAPSSSYSFIRKIGTLSTDGAQVSDVRFINGVIADATQYNSFVFKSVIDVPGETLLTLSGQDLQPSSAATIVTSPSSTPTKLLSGGHTTSGTYTEHMYLDSAGRFVWKNTGTDLTLSKIATDTLGSNAHISIQREDLNSSTVDDPTLDAAETITRHDGSIILSGRINADTENRVQISQTGVIMFGSGTASPDVGIYRPKADSLALMNGDKLYLDYAIDFATDGDNLAANKAYVDSAINNANLDDLDDVDVAGAVDGAFLLYSSGTSEWVDSSDITFVTDTLTVTGRTAHDGTTNYKVTTVASPSHTVSTPDDNVLLCQTSTGDITITLPSTADDGDTIIIKDIEGEAGLSNDLTLVGDSGVTIDGEATYEMGAPYDVIKIISYGGDWFIL